MSENIERVSGVSEFVSEFARDSGMSVETEGRELISDIITDIMHYADAHGIDNNTALALAVNNYACERQAADRSELDCDTINPSRGYTLPYLKQMMKIFGISKDDL